MSSPIYFVKKSMNINFHKQTKNSSLCVLLCLNPELASLFLFKLQGVPAVSYKQRGHIMRCKVGRKGLTSKLNGRDGGGVVV